VDPERGWGGGERQVAGLVTYLAGCGHANHLLCCPGGPLAREMAGTVAKLHPLKMRNDIDFSAVPAVRRLLRQENYDIVHFHTKRAHALSGWLGKAPATQKRLVTRRMDYPIRRGWIDRYLYNRCVDGVVAISQPIADLLAEGGVAREKIRMIPSGVDPAPYENIPPPAGGRTPFVVGTAAILEQRKGIKFLLEAAAELKRRGRPIRYRIAGDGWEKNNLLDQARKLGVEGDVEFLGFVADMPSFMASIDIFVLPSLFEGLGVAALEAMAAARPVVASAIGGLKELVVDGETGLLVPRGDSGSLARALEKLVQHADLVRSLGERGRARLRERFTMDRMARANEAFYYDLLEANERG
jgi:glycosyltransferase involved in cell wall biosynthesis